EHRLMKTRLDGPEPAVGLLQDEPVLEPGDVRVTAQDGSRLALETVRAIPVVVVPMGDELPARFGTGAVALRADRQSPFDAEVAHGRLVPDQVGDRIASVVDDDQLAVAIRPLAETGQRQPEDRPAG